MVEFLKKISARMGGTTDEEEIEDYLETLGVEEEHFEEEADMWIEPFVLDSVDMLNKIVTTLDGGSIALINIEPMYKRNKSRLKQALDKLKRYIIDINGDLVRVSEYKILATPKGVKVDRRKKK